MRQERLKKYGRLHGTAKICAEEFGVSPQQWSPWECGQRTPDELRMEEIAAFFGVTVAYLRRPKQQFEFTFAQFAENAAASATLPPEEPSLPTQQRSLTAFMQTMTQFFEGGFDVTFSFTPRKPPVHSIPPDAPSQKAGDALDALREFITR